jgi:hypothetical protein
MMSEFKTGFFARMNELSNQYNYQPTKYYIIRTFDNSDRNGIKDCIFTALNRYELWLKVHNYILSKYPLHKGLYNEDWFKEVGYDYLDETSEKESKEDSDYIIKLINSSFKGIIDNFEHKDTEWFEEFNKLI